MRAVKTIYLGGVPASGKTTVFRAVRDGLLGSRAAEFRHGLCRGVSRGPFRMLGVFDGSTFEGTDRLSNCVIDDALDYVAGLERGGQRCVVLAEGDRLFCKRFLRATRAEAYVVEAYARVLAARRAERAARGDGQSDAFLKSKRTKVDKLRRRLGIRTLWNNAPEDRDRIVNLLVSRAMKWTE